MLYVRYYTLSLSLTMESREWMTIKKIDDSQTKGHTVVALVRKLELYM